MKEQYSSEAGMASHSHNKIISCKLEVGTYPPPTVIKIKYIFKTE